MDMKRINEINKEMNELIVKYNNSNSKKNKHELYKQIIDYDKKIQELKNEK